jgi:hypothetical protein
MKKTHAILAILLSATAGCGENKQSTDDLITVDVTASYPKKELILQDFMDVEYVPLETTDEFLTSANIRAFAGRDILVVINRRRGNDDILVFDRHGKGLRKINRYGQSGEEYTNVQDIVLDEDNDEMFVNNTFSSKMLVYDLFGNFKRSFRLRDDLVISHTGNLDRDNLIGHDAYSYIDNGVLKEEKRNCFLTISKQDGSIKEIPVPYEEKKSTTVLRRDANGRTADRSIYNRELIPHRDGWILAESSSDTIYSYSPGHAMKPFIVRTPSVQSMDPEVFLYPGILTGRYGFMQTVRKEFNFAANTGFPRTDLMYDRQENTLHECVVYNDDFTDKKPLSLVYETFMLALLNSDIACMIKLEAYELVEAYEKGELKGRLKDVAATLDEDSNPVIMLIKHRK